MQGEAQWDTDIESVEVEPNSNMFVITLFLEGGRSVYVHLDATQAAQVAASLKEASE
jgi:phosphotransferase system HPr-like phosphotransfer protein